MQMETGGVVVVHKKEKQLGSCNFLETQPTVLSKAAVFKLSLSEGVRSVSRVVLSKQSNLP